MHLDHTLLLLMLGSTAQQRQPRQTAQLALYPHTTLLKELQPETTKFLINKTQQMAASLPIVSIQHSLSQTRPCVLRSSQVLPIQMFHKTGLSKA